MNKKLTGLEIAAQFIPCAFCGGTDLVIDKWWFPQAGEVDVVECRKCHAAAPATVWNNRSPMAEAAKIMEGVKK